MTYEKMYWKKVWFVLSFVITRLRNNLFLSSYFQAKNNILNSTKSFAPNNILEKLDSPFDHPIYSLILENFNGIDSNINLLVNSERNFHSILLILSVWDTCSAKKIYQITYTSARSITLHRSISFFGQVLAYESKVMEKNAFHLKKKKHTGVF